MRWSLAEKLQDLFWEHLVAMVLRGTGQVGRPIEFSFDDSCLLNFGTTPALMKLDLAHLGAEPGTPPPVHPTLTDEQKAYRTRCMGFLEMNYSELHSSTGVYSLEPWLQEMYRDCLDIDHLDALHQNEDLLEEELKTIPARLLSIGVPNEVVTRIIHAFQSFRSVQADEKARERNKTSVLRVRSYASVVARIDETLREAEPYVMPTAGLTGQTSLQGLFDCWKQATFSLMDIRKEITGLSALANNEGIDDLSAMMHAVRATLSRTAEDEGQPQCPILYTENALQICPRQVVDEEIEALLVHDIIGHVDLTAERLETRRYGPLCVLIAPGCGSARYSTELRDFHAKRLERLKGDRRGYDINRRATYPLNYIVFPNLVPPERALEDLADAFLEYKALACTPAYQTFITEVRRRFPIIFSDDTDGRRHASRRQLAKYVAGFVRWAKYGRLQELPELERFVQWARKRIRRPQFLIPPRYRCVMEDFADGSEERRDAIYRRHKKDRYAVDRIAVALAILSEDVTGALRATSFLPAGTRKSRYLERAIEKANESGAANERDALYCLQQFMFADADLKGVYLATESQFNGEVHMVRTRAAEAMQRDLTYEQAAKSIAKRQREKLQVRHDLANTQLDQDLLGLLYCAEKNYSAAAAELASYMQRMEAQREKRAQRPQKFDGAGLRKRLGNRSSRRGRSGQDEHESETRVVGLAREARIYEDDFVYYNLGSLMLELGDLPRASDYFSRFCLWAAQQHWHLFGEFARELNADLESGMANPSSSGE